MAAAKHERRFHMYHRLLPAAVVLLIASVPTAFAQVTTGQITGVISDPTGAIIPKVNVRIVNADTGSERTATTNDLGAYTVPLLPPGNYRVSATGTGFKPVTRS